MIGGFTDPAGSRSGIGALLVGHFDGTTLRFAGKVGIGPGFTAQYLKRVRLELEAAQHEPRTKQRVGASATHCSPRSERLIRCEHSAPCLSDVGPTPQLRPDDAPIASRCSQRQRECATDQTRDRNARWPTFSAASMKVRHQLE